MFKSLTRPWWRAGCLLVGLSLVVPILVSLGTVLAGLPDVVQTGMCPPAPTDIPAYPCTPGEYILRMTLGPWAVLGHILIWLVWSGLLSLIGGAIALAWVIPSARRSMSKPSPMKGESDDGQR